MIVKANLRSGGARLIAAALTIIVSVAFVVAVTGVLASFNKTIRGEFSAQYSGADLVVTNDYDPLEESTEKKINSIKGVKETQRIESTFARLPSGGFTEVSVWPKNSHIEVTTGKAPTKADQILFDTSVAKQENKEVGDQVELSVPSFEGGQDTKRTYTITGIGPMPSAALQVTNHGIADLDPGFNYLRVFTDKSADTSKVQSAIADTLAGSEEVVSNTYGAKLAGDYKVATEDQLIEERMNDVTGDSATVVTFIGAFIAVALFVAVLVISNTFQVLVASRARSLALLRAVGATRSQLRNATLAEGAVLGLVSSVIGVFVGWGAAMLLPIALRTYVQANFQTAPLPVLAVALGLAVGITVTVAASFVPALKATRVSPIDALAPADIPAPDSRFPWIRLVLGTVLTALGAAVTVVGANAGDMTLTLPGAFMAFCGVLVLSRVFVPPLVELIGRVGEKIFRSPTLGLVARNVKLAPRRTASTTAALLIGVTLVATIFMGAQTTRTTIDTTLSEDAPIDLAAQSGSDKTVNTLKNSEIVKDLVTLPGTQAEASEPLGQDGDPESTHTQLVGVEKQKYSVPRSTKLLPPPGVVYIKSGPNTEDIAGKKVTFTAGQAGEAGDAGKKSVKLTVKIHNAVPAATALANADDIAALGLTKADGQTWVRLADDASISQITKLKADLEKTGVFSDADGSLQRASYAQIISIMMGIVLGLLGASIIISIVGVGNTLSLATIERKRETALLRTLGLSRWAAARMVAGEAMLMAIVSLIVGTGLGVLFGWAGVRSLLTAEGITVAPDVPWTMFAVLATVTAFAALAASLFPAIAASRTQPAQGVAQL
ncbi:ABC transporter permease [Brevibacterium sp. HMSC24B04]|uniref:ABC transporter permease n=1 Tax=Brevibacterium sp. HMSC24B04 TaxID=1581060 RepID=UPI0008A4C8E4|nr:FtsX-like permease family protein [Brevibacterium sp. HMSC24B04]OFT94404.1 ABC transporter permease [Brevibacterium sp. HMSC24B04]